MKKQPLISVVIPTYNRKKLLQRAVRSVLKQTYQNIEIWIIDDCSTDGTDKAIARIQDERIHYICLEKNSGPSAARNEGIRRSNGQIIAFLDSDDTWRKDKLEKQLSMMNEGFKAVFCKYHIHADRDSVMPTEETFDIEGTEHGFLDLLLYQNKIGAPTLILSKGAAESIGAFCEDFHTLEDWEYVLRLAEKHKIGFVPEVLVDVYQSNEGVNSQRGTKRADVLLYLLQRYWKKYDKKNAFDNIIRYIYDDLEVAPEKERNELRNKLFDIMGYNCIADYSYRQSAALWRQVDSVNAHILNTDNTVAEHNNAIVALNMKLGEHNDAIIELNTKLGEHNDAIIELNRKLGEHNDAIIELNTKLGEHNDAIIELNRKLGEHNDAIIELNTKLGEHNDAILCQGREISVHNDEIIKLNSVLGEHNEAINSQNMILSDHNNAINRIDLTIADIIQIIEDRTARIENLEKEINKTISKT